MKAVIAVLVISMFLIPAVQAEEETAQPGSHRTASSDGASVGFKTLKDGDIVAETFVVQFSVSGMGVAPAGSDIPNTGHHHLLIDLEELPDMNQPLPATENIVHFGKGQMEAEVVLPPGKHSLQLLFADYSHTPHNPVVMSDKIVITVSANPPVEDAGDD
jgi:hypothetical protein